MGGRVRPGMFTLSDGTIEGPVQAALLAVTDWRDLKVAAEARPPDMDADKPCPIIVRC